MRASTAEARCHKAPSAPIVQVPATTVGQLAHAPRSWGNLQETFCGVPGRKSEKQEESAGESCHQRQS